MFKVLIFLVGHFVLARSEEIDYKKLYYKALKKFGGNHLENNQPALPQTQLAGDKVHYEAFKQHAKKVFEHNSMQNKEWDATINRFALETDEELKRHLGLNISMADFLPDLQEPSILVERSEENTDLPETVDYRNKMTPVTDQGVCGSCWAFAAVASLEYQINRNRESAQDFAILSEQEYVGCVYGSYRNSCDGGWPSRCYDWSMERNSYLATEQRYPYSNYDSRTASRCLHDAHKTPNGLSGYSITKAATYVNTDAQLLRTVADPNLGVIIAAMAVIDDFYSYEGGIYSSDLCSPQHEKLNHAVNIVGYGTDTSSGNNYWLIRNSWGPDWGEEGYFRMKRGKGNYNLNMCQISTYPHYPTVTGPSPSQDDESDSNNDCTWTIKENKRFRKLLSGMNKDFETARQECKDNSKCRGVVCRTSERCRLARRLNGKWSDYHTSYVKNC